MPDQTFSPGDRIIAQAWPTATPLTGVYFSDDIDGGHWVTLDVHGKTVIMPIVRPHASYRGDTIAEWLLTQ